MRKTAYAEEHIKKEIIFQGKKIRGRVIFPCRYKIWWTNSQKKTEKMQKKPKQNNNNKHTHENRLYKVKKPLPYSKGDMVITFSVKLYYIYGWSVYYI